MEQRPTEEQVEQFIAERAKVMREMGVTSFLHDDEAAPAPEQDRQPDAKFLEAWKKLKEMEPDRDPDR